MPGLLDPDGTLPELPDDVAAQLAAVGDPASAKNTMFLAAGSPQPAGLPPGAVAASRPEGTLITTDPAKAETFVSGPLTDDGMARLLDYPESKREALAGGGIPRVVQAVSRGGGVVHEHAASPGAIPAAVRAALAMVPGGRVRLTTPQAAVRRRLAGLLGG